MSCLFQLTWHYCFRNSSLHCPFSYKFCFLKDNLIQSFKLLAFMSLINCNLIIRDYKGLFFLLHYHRAAVKVQNPQNSVYLVLMTNTGLHPSGLSKTQQTRPLNEETKTVVPLKYLLKLPPFSNQTPSSCCLFTFKTIRLSALTLLVLCMSRNTRCRSHPLSHLHQEGTGRRAAASVLRECSGRWHAHTQSGCCTSSSRHILLTYLLCLHFT